MEKKRFLLAILLVTIFLITASQAFAGCCQGIIGCSRAFFGSECSELAAFTPLECEEIDDCDIVACCHNITGIPKATYRSTCLGMSPTPPYSPIKDFTTNPAADSAEAEYRCSGATLPCQWANCEQPNSGDCLCGSTSTSDSSAFCCADDGAVFPSFGACSASPSCRSGAFYSIHGRILSPDGVGISGAEVKAGKGKQTISDENGNFTIDYLPDLSTGTVVAIKNSTINSTSYSISSADVFDIIVILDIPAVPPEGVEICTNGVDDDGDQFFWSNPLADTCDSDCGTVSRTVTATYFKASEYNSVSEEDFCSDRFDNDCDGFTDCQDIDCIGNSPSCMETFCGDGVIQFPNRDGVYEQCDYYNISGEPILNATGDPIGSDSLCPGKCLSPGDAKECTCQYDAVCGNAFIDEPLEDCDGVFLAAENRWHAGKYVGTDCTIDQCGKPNSIMPCQCPATQVCGDGKVDAPEECDLGGIDGAGPASGNCVGCSPDCTCPPEAAVCGNNIIEQGEDCDGKPVDLTEDVWELFKTRKFGCSKAGCALPQPPAWSDTEYADYLEVLDVTAGCRCPTQCKQDPPGPNLSSPQSVQFKREIKLNWTDECLNENAKAYNVYRCEATGPDGAGCDAASDGVFSIINSAPLGTTNSFSDTNFKGAAMDPVTGTYTDRYYCYMIEGIYGDMITPNGQQKSEFDGTIHCIKAGVEQCFKFKEFYPWAEEFCSGINYNVRSTCDANNSIIEFDDPEGDQTDCNKQKLEFGRITDYVCVGPFAEGHPSKEGETECIAKSVCDYCNDPFGLFGYSNDNRRFDYDDYEATAADVGRAPEGYPTDAEKRGRLLFEPCVDLDFCYLDYAYSNANKFYEYGNDTSCYDFNSKPACSEYNESFGGGLCEWVWHPLYRELGIGICRTNVTEEQECERCHDPENEVFNRCDRDSCALYGRCYYDLANIGPEPLIYAYLAEMGPNNTVKRAQKDSDTAFYKCTHERNISCESYDTQEDCSNSSSPYSIGGVELNPSNVDVDVYGNMSAGSFVKTGGTNTITTQSDDFFSFGKCQWVSQKITNITSFEDGEIDDEYFYERTPICIKNADDSPYTTERRLTTYSDKIEKVLYSDCRGLGGEPGYNSDISDVSSCRKDFINPATTIPLYNNISDPMRINGKFSYPAVVYDAALDYSSSYPVTYACVAEDGLDCYPNQSAVFVSREAGNTIAYDNVGYNVSYNFSERGFQSGKHTIKYFSEDISHNLEVVKDVVVYIDADAPNIVLSLSNISYEISEDIWRSNLTLRMQVVPRYSGDDEYAFCNAKMYLGNVSIYLLEDVVNEYNDTWIRNYTGMFDNYYTFWYRCEDDVGNIAEANVTLHINGDKSITNPLPKTTLNDTSVVLSVDTGTNAECRYLHSVNNIPAFNDNVTFDASVFSTMTPFDVTGSVESSVTAHKARITTTHGYHRYYVKCKMFSDGKIRGNSGDQIRFAVDKQPPVTQFSTDKTPYNSWYNQNIKVSLVCSDPPIMGNNLDWRYGCNRTYYCIGRNCADFEGEWKEYSAPIPLNQTTYISYYSVDSGSAAETPIENTLFQIDKTPPEIDMYFFKGVVIADVLVMNTAYDVIVISDKPFISPAVEQPTINYNSNPSKFSGSIKLFPTLNTSIWKGVFFIENINANTGFEGDGLFTVSGADYHNVSGTSTTTMRIDTKPPSTPVLDPSLENPSPEESEYQAQGYAIRYYNGTYYTNRNDLLLTGYTDEFLEVVGVTAVDDVDGYTRFTQTPARAVFEDKVLSGFAGYHEMKVSGDITRRANNSLHVGFDQEETTIGPRTIYGAYGMFYDVTNLSYLADDKQYTSIVTYPTIEESLRVDRPILFYDQEYPSFWFGLNLSLTSFTNNTFYIAAYDNASNLVRYPDYTLEYPFITFFSDPIAPSVVSHFPNDGSTSQNTMDVEVIVKEGKKESGLDFSSISFKINTENVSYLVEHVDSLEQEDPSHNYYRIYYPASGLEDREYYVEVDGLDMSMNAFDETSASSHWSFTVDRKVPAYPDFELIGGFAGPTGDTRWYVDHSPDFIINFSRETNPVTIIDTFMEDSPTQGEAATCNRLNISPNSFRCSFTEKKTAEGSFWADYGVIVTAYKILDDGTRSPTGTYGPLRFTVDDQAPQFTANMKTRFMDNINLSLSALVSNEKHRLYADLEILGERFVPLLSSNNGSLYYFEWGVPDYSKEQEGPTSIKITISDYAQNKRSITVPVYIDLTAPRINNVSIDIQTTIPIGTDMGTELFTSMPNVTVSGKLVDDDIEKVWIIPGDFNETTGTLEGKKYANLKMGPGGYFDAFEVSVRLWDPGAGKLASSPILYNYMLINQINNMTLRARDEAGHVSDRKIRVISDLAAPLAPSFCIGEDWTKCIPLP